MFYENWKLNKEFDDPAKAVAHFKDMANYIEWKLQRYIHGMTETSPSSQEALPAADKVENSTPPQPIPAADQLVQMFGWEDPVTKKMMDPRLAVPEECLSYNRASDPAWDKLIKITQDTRSGLNELAIRIPLIHPADIANAARASARSKDRRENIKREKLGLPKINYNLPPIVKKPKGQKVAKPSTDPTTWTD